MHVAMANNISSCSNLLSDQSQFTAKVSTVLNKNVKEFGKKFLFDNREDTCWNSDQGTPQFISLTFDSVIKTISEIQIQFQGGLWVNRANLLLIMIRILQFLFTLKTLISYRHSMLIFKTCKP